MGYYFRLRRAGTSNGLLQIVQSGISGSEASIDKPAQLISFVEKSDEETNWICPVLVDLLGRCQLPQIAYGRRHVLILRRPRQAHDLGPDLWRRQRM